MKLPSIVSGNGGRRHFLNLILGTAVVLAVAAAAVFALLGLVDAPGFYAQLPWLEGYVTSWRDSTHHEVPCSDCHFPAGFGGTARARSVGLSLLIQGITNTGSTGAFHFTGSHSCTREGCHADILSNRGDIEWRSIHFSHRDHLGKVKRGLEPACSTCHQSLVHGTGQPVQTESCTICHFKALSWEEDISRCRLCHVPDHLPTGRFDHTSVLARGMDCVGCHAGVTQGTGDVDRDRCVACHTLGSRAEQYDNPEKVHAVHVGKEGFACTFCHRPIKHQLNVLTASQSEDCAQCHRQPHVNTRELYMGISADKPEAKAQKAPMAATHVHCKGCHTAWQDVDGGQTLTANGKGCVSCHGEGYDRILKQWRQLLERDLAAARPAVRAAVNATRRRRAGDDARQAADAAAAKLSQVVDGHGVHNIAFAVTQLDAAVGLANQALAKTGAGRSFPRLADAKRLTANECARCHLDLPRTVRYEGKSFPHADHVSSVEECTSCHTPFSDHGKLAWGKKACATCHGDVPLPHPAGWRSKMGAVVAKVGFATCLGCHDTAEARSACTPCHQRGPVGDVSWHDMKISHAKHAAQGVDCTTCHTELKDHGKVALTPDDCNQCHGVPMPHPADFADTHPQEVKKVGIDTCVTCHPGGIDNELCQGCHG